MQEWYNHELALREDTFRLQQTHISKILQSLQKSLVFHLADHHAAHLMICCPQFYFQSVLRVWQDPSNFFQVHQSPRRRKIQIHGSIPGALRCKYAWGINANARLPQGCVFQREEGVSQRPKCHCIQWHYCREISTRHRFLHRTDDPHMLPVSLRFSSVDNDLGKASPVLYSNSATCTIGLGER